MVASIDLCYSPFCSPARFTSKLLRVRDLGSSYKLLSDDTLLGLVTSLACLGVHERMAHAERPERRLDGWVRENLLQSEPHYWLLNSGVSGTQLEERETIGGALTREVMLEKLLGVAQVTSTTPMTLVYSSQTILFLGVRLSNNSGSTDKTESGHSLSQSSSSCYILALDVSGSQTIKVLWLLPLGSDEPAQGQIATVDIDQETIMVATTLLGVYAYN